MSINGKVEIDCSVLPSRTKQAEKDSCDVNKILKRYVKTGVLSHQNRSSPLYGDFSNLPDFLAAQNLVISATQSFEALPAIVRKEFNNDPAEMVAFCSDPKNADRALELGLVEKPIASDLSQLKEAVSASNEKVVEALKGLKTKVLGGG